MINLNDTCNIFLSIFVSGVKNCSIKHDVTFYPRLASVTHPLRVPPNESWHFGVFVRLYSRSSVWQSFCVVYCNIKGNKQRRRLWMFSFFSSVRLLKSSIMLFSLDTFHVNFLSFSWLSPFHSSSIPALSSARSQKDAGARLA